MKIKDLLNKFKLNLNIPEAILNMECKDYKNYEKYDENDFGIESVHCFYTDENIELIRLYVFEPTYECSEWEPVYDIEFRNRTLPPDLHSYDKYGRKTHPSIIY